MLDWLSRSIGAKQAAVLPARASWHPEGNDVPHLMFYENGQAVEPVRS
jgi:hypothetical protein